MKTQDVNPTEALELERLQFARAVAAECKMGNELSATHFARSDMGQEIDLETARADDFSTVSFEHQRSIDVLSRPDTGTFYFWVHSEEGVQDFEFSVDELRKLVAKHVQLVGWPHERLALKIQELQACSQEELHVRLRENQRQLVPHEPSRHFPEDYGSRSPEQERALACWVEYEACLNLLSLSSRK